MFIKTNPLALPECDIVSSTIPNQKRYNSRKRRETAKTLPLECAPPPTTSVTADEDYEPYEGSSNSYHPSDLLVIQKLIMKKRKKKEKN